jgi:photosystem II stability/assembly factor-like uncharacterized protein
VHPRVGAPLLDLVADDRQDAVEAIAWVDRVELRQDGRVWIVGPAGQLVQQGQGGEAVLADRVRLRRAVVQRYRIDGG